ncbi:TPA: hypothetical protein HA235_02775 [Candidatus Woesearchaeota archaeon]|nr:hypothetical protein [Candidatus Woesearchaeota archaeon]HIH31608.1 hypothetical protein [Candidatus Woesearchaeota archaeon]HIH55340.1 hypothetical protein [Candidatus Woesearchaeota archaeon]HIJ14002.1 hypothetical protein [Candidatus Woesearchaeota archaeon]
MNEAIENAVEELKRVDHSIFVSLKYTRTVDILINILVRMVDCYEFLFYALLKYAEQHKLISSIPSTPKEKVTLLKDVFKEQEVHDNVDLYLLLKAMLKANFSRENEYRRHVAMRAIIAGREEIININIISRYYEFLTSFFHLVDNIRKETYVLGSGILVGQTAEGTTDEENPNNPYWVEVKQMKEDADAEIARDKEIRERIRLDKANKEIQKQKDFKKYIEKKVKRITKRKPKIKPKRVIPKDKLRLMQLKKKSKKKSKKK